MPTVRASVSSVLAQLRAELEAEARRAAGSNSLISRAEEQQLGDSVTREAAAEVRAAGGAGSTVTVDALVDAAEARLRAFIDGVNQTSGAGAATLSQAEIQAVAATHPEAGQRLARAYELLTGKAVPLPAVVPPPAPVADAALGDVSVLFGHAWELVKSQLRGVSGDNELLSASERANLEPEFLRTAVNAAPPPRNVVGLANHVMNEVVRPRLAEVGIGVEHLDEVDASGNPVAIPISPDAMRRLIEQSPGVAGLLADALVAIGAPRPDLPGLPRRRFGVTGSEPPPPAPGATEAPLPAVLDALRVRLEHDVRAAAGNNDFISLAEQPYLSDAFLRQVAADVRATGGQGSSLRVGPVVDGAMARLSALLAAHDGGGPGAATLSEAEILAVATTDVDAAQRLAQAFEAVTGTPVSVVGPVTPPATPSMGDLGDLNEIHRVLFDYLRGELTRAAGSNLELNANERRTLPPGLIQDAAEATPPPRTVENVLAWMHDHVVLTALADAGLHPQNLGTFDRVLPFHHDDLVPLVAAHPELAGLLADAVAWLKGARPHVPGLPTTWFRNPDHLLGPPVTGVHEVPGAMEPVVFPDVPRVDAVLQQLSSLVEAMDWSRNGSVSLSEAESFVSKLSNNSTYRQGVAALLFDLREQAYAKVGRSPTVAEIKAELATLGERVHRLGWIESHSISAWDPIGLVDREPHAQQVLDLVRYGLDIDQEPYIRLFDHEGDRAVADRRPLVLDGEPAAVVRNIVFHFNKADNDNHWPRWSGVSTSRYVLDAGETQSVVDTLRAQPAARQQALFEALVAWFDKAGVGTLYLEEPARPIMEALAVELGHPRRFPPGTSNAPALPRSF